MGLWSCRWPMAGGQFNGPILRSSATSADLRDDDWLGNPPFITPLDGHHRRGPRRTQKIAFVANLPLLINFLDLFGWPGGPSPPAPSPITNQMGEGVETTLGFFCRRLGLFDRRSDRRRRRLQLLERLG